MSENAITLEKFKAWLEGVEEMQDDGWVPTVVQWTKIREKIELIEEQPTVSYPQAYSPPPQYPGSSYSTPRDLAVEPPPMIFEESVLEKPRMPRSPGGGITLPSEIQQPLVGPGGNGGAQLVDLNNPNNPNNPNSGYTTDFA